MKKEFKLLPYNPIWKDQYIAEKEAITRVFGDLLCSIHHIGSTAIPLTLAKPEIDILAVAKDDQRLSDYDRAIEALGYRVRGELVTQGGTPGRFYYSKDVNYVRTHKMHVCQIGHPEIMAKLLFVRYLNDHPEAAAAYADLKVGLSNAYNYGRQFEKYLAGKSDFIADVLRKAQKEY